MLTREFRRLVSLLVALAGFSLVAGALLMQGECLLVVAFRSILAFLAIWAFMSLLGSLLGLVADSQPADEVSEERNPQN